MVIISKVPPLWGRSFRTIRHFSLSSGPKLAAYEGDGKTTVTVLNKQPDFGLMINGYSKQGFRLNNGAFIYGPMALFPHTALSWNVEGDHDIHEKSLKLFALIEPKIDLLVIGYGDTYKKLNNISLHEFRMSRKMNMEILPCDKAAATFNYLCGEGRWVAGAFIPPMRIRVYEHELSEQITRGMTVGD